MSHEILKRISINEQKHSIKITCACNNVRPLSYSTCEICDAAESFEENMRHLFFDVLSGAFHLNKSCGEIKIVTDICMNIKADILGDAFMFDLDYESNFNTQANTILFKQVFMPCVDKTKVNECSAFLDSAKKSLSELAKKMPEYKAEYLKKLGEKGKVRIQSAASSNVYSGYTVFIDMNNEVILAPQSSYVSGSRILNNSNNTAIFFGPGSRALWNYLNFDGYWSGDYTKKEIIELKVRNTAARNNTSVNAVRHTVTEKCNEEFAYVEKIIKEKLSHLTMTQVPYMDFPIK